MSEDLAIEPGSEVVMHFTLAMEDGTVAETTREGEPLSFAMGDGTLIEGLELALYGLTPGDKQALRLDPREGFGFRDPGNEHDMPRSEFDPSVELTEGMIIGFSMPSGEEVPGTIISVGTDLVRVDFNHPLAGHEVLFDVEILSVRHAEQ